MAAPLFQKDRTPACRYCRHGRTIAGLSDAIACKKQGVVPAGHACGRFRYDPLKRVPQPAAPLCEYDKRDFLL